MVIKHSITNWITADANGNLTMEVSAGALGQPTPVPIALDDKGKPLTPKDTRLCAWVWTKASKLDKDSKAQLKNWWIGANRDQFTVRVSHGKGEERVWVPNVYTLGSMVARPGASSEIDFRIEAPAATTTKIVERAPVAAVA